MVPKTTNSLQPDHLLEQVGHSLFMLRSNLHKTLEAVADEIGVTHPVISKIENGRYPNLSLTLLVKLANYYEVPLQQIVPLESTQVFNYNQHGDNGSQINSQVINEAKEGYLLAMEHYQQEVAFLREQVQVLTAKLG